MSKVSKAVVLYTFHPDVPDYVCGDCMFEKDAGGKDFCALMGAATTISESSGSCNAYAHGEPEKAKLNIPWLSVFTPVQLGYAQNRPGFGCRRCANFVPGKNDCLIVDKSSEGDTPGEINPNACCNAWKRDSKRGGMSNSGNYLLD